VTIIPNTELKNPWSQWSICAKRYNVHDTFVHHLKAWDINFKADPNRAFLTLSKIEQFKMRLKELAKRNPVLRILRCELSFYFIMDATGRKRERMERTAVSFSNCTSVTVRGRFIRDTMRPSNADSNADPRSQFFFPGRRFGSFLFPFSYPIVSRNLIILPISP